MAQFDRHQAKATFDEYVAAFDLSDSRIKLKHDHSLRVAVLCEEIALSRGMDADSVDLAWLCGLLHDIGRFEQLRIWKTFRDAESCRHPYLGLAVLDGDSVMEGKKLSDADGRIERFTNNSNWIPLIKNAVALHGDLALPNSLDEQTRVFCEIVRDADKVDVIRVFGQSDVEDVLGSTISEFLSSKISDSAMKGFREHRCLGPCDRCEKTDSLVGVACLVFEIVNPGAKEALARLGYFDALLEHPFGITPQFSNEDTRTKWKEISLLKDKILPI